MTESVSSASDNVCAHPLLNAVQLGITMLEPPLIISGKIDFHLVDSVGKLFPDVEARVLREDGSEADISKNAYQFNILLFLFIALRYFLVVYNNQQHFLMLDKT